VHRSSVASGFRVVASGAVEVRVRYTGAIVHEMHRKGDRICRHLPADHLT
jgi:hypothetical protein